MPSNQTKIKFQLKNIGPHEDLTFQSEKNIDYAIFATNGQGKTFISRCFAALQDDNYPYVGNLTSFGRYTSSFDIEINGTSSKFEINNGNITRDKNIDRIFYVYNSDYVNDNVEKKDYKPDNTISGIILGKNQINLKNEKDELEALEKESINAESLIKEEIQKAKDVLAKAKVSKNMKEYKDITFDGILNLPSFDHNEYETILNKVNTLSKMPEDLPDINHFSFLVDSINYDELEKLLKELVTPSNYEKDFVDYIKNNVDFIEHGLNLVKGNADICPFCKKPIDNTSLIIIHQYSRFLEDKESNVTKKLISFYKSFEEYESNIINIENQLKNCKRSEQSIRLYIPDIDKLSYTMIEDEFASVKKSIGDAKSYINKKLNNLSSLSIELSQCDYRNSIISLNKGLDFVNKEIDKINKMKNNIQTIIKGNKKELCVELSKKIRSENSQTITNYISILEKIKLKKQEISHKEMTNSIDKKELISATFSKLLEMFFHGKYEFDKNSFEIQLRKTYKINDGRFTLSDGEKSVIAFAYYIANVFDVVKAENDYEKIIFVIDDPISSMDFSYVYETATIIRNLKDILKIQFDKKIVLTHNFEFFNILKRNKVSKGSYIMSNGIIEEMRQEMLLPYECHLNEIYNISDGKAKPSHTTPNSIRHIIETICSFEKNEKSSKVLESFIKENVEFKDNDYIYTLMQDLSHGTYRENMPYLDQELITACKKVIEFIENHYPGQLTSIRP